MFPDQPLDEVAQLVPGISELNIPLPPQAFTTKPFPKQWLAGPPDSPPKIVGMAFVGLQQVWGVNRGVDRTLRGVSERIGNG